MSLSKYRIKLPLLEPHECRGVAMEEVLEDIKFSKNCFVVFSPYVGPAEVLFTDLNEDVMASLIVLMCKHKQVHQFLKMAVIATEKLNRSPKAGWTFYEAVIKFINQHFRDIIPKKKEA